MSSIFRRTKPAGALELLAASTMPAARPQPTFTACTEAEPAAEEAPPPAADAPSPSANAPLTAVILACNEAEALAVTLPQIKAGVDQVVIVDMGSTDASLAVYAEYLTADDEIALYPRDSLFRFGFAHARNYGATLARHDIIFAIDADEWIDVAELTKARRTWFPAGGLDHHLVARRNYEFVPDIAIKDVEAIASSATFGAETHCRIYKRRRALQWEGIVHEELRDSGQPTAQLGPPLDVTLHHLNAYKAAMSGDKPYLYAYLLLRAVKYPEFRSGMNSFYFDTFVPTHLEEFVRHANEFAAANHLEPFSEAEIRSRLNR